MAATGKKSGKPDFATIGGIVLAVGGIVGGLLLEGGKIRDVAQITAAIIVLGGTFGAVMINTPPQVLLGALKRLREVFLYSAEGPESIIEEIIGYATKARKSGLVSLEQDAEAIAHPFLRKAMGLAVDGTDMQELRCMLELEIEVQESHAHAEAKVFECAGGYAPTIGIIGAVMGLIQVMKNLANIDEVGHGIAVAFVATVYGVGVANVLLIPAANKIKARVQQQMELRQLMLEGVIGIIEGLNPKLIRSKLEAFQVGAKAPAKAEAARRSVPGAAKPLAVGN
ncbi:MAG: flagellar motor protein [Bryobacteraceae bacterium]